MPRFPYKQLGRDLDRDFRNNLNQNFKDIESDIKETKSNLQTQLNQLVIEGDSSVEAAQARVDEQGNTFTTLKERLDTKEEQFTSLLAQKATKTDLETTNSNVNDLQTAKADKSYVDTQIQSVASGSPKDVFATLTDLQNAFPTGDTNIYIVSADGNWYYWDGSAWTAGGVYQGKVLEDRIVTPRKTSFFTIGKNLFNPATVNKGYVVDSNSGNLLTSDTFHASDYIEVEPSTTYIKTSVYAYAFYDENKIYISGGTANPLTTPVGCHYVRISINQSTNLYTYQFEKGSVLTEYESYKEPYINKGKVEPIKLNDVSDLWITNLYDKNSVLLDTIVSDTNGSLSTVSGFITTDYVPVEENTEYLVSRARRVAYYDINKNFISGHTTSVGKVVGITTPFNARFLRTDYHGENDGLSVDLMQIVKGTEPQPYRPYNEKIIPNKLLSPKNTVIILPPKLYGVANKEINIYFENIVKNNLKNYYVNVICTKGKQEEGRWTYTSTSPETLTLTIELYDEDAYVVTRANTTIYIKSDAVGNGVTKSALVIGDSTINAGKITQRMLDNFSTDVMNLTLLGSRGVSPNLHEGRGGWSIASYRTNAEYSGVVNPFYNPTSADFDFAYYMSQKGYISVDYVILNLGINDVFAYGTDKEVNTKIDQMLTDFDFLINNIKSYDTNIKIGLNITIPPNASQNAFGVAYGSGQTQWRYKRNNVIWIKRMIDYYRNKEAEKIYLVPINVNIDTVNNINDGVHPKDEGYYQLGDVMYYFLKSFEA